MLDKKNVKYVVQKPFSYGNITFNVGDEIDNPEDYLIEGRFVQVMQIDNTMLFDDSSTIIISD